MHAREILDDLARLGCQQVVELPFYVQTDRKITLAAYQKSALKILSGMHPDVAIVHWNVTRLVSVDEIKEYFRFLEKALIYTAEIDISHPGSRISMGNIQQAIAELADEEIEVSVVGSIHPEAVLAEEVLQSLEQMPEGAVVTLPLLVHFSDESGTISYEEYELKVIQLLLGNSPSKIIFNWNADGDVDENDIRSWLLIGREAMAERVMLDISYYGADSNKLTIMHVVKQINREAVELGGHIDIVMRAETILDIVCQPDDGVIMLPYGVRFGDEPDALDEQRFRTRFVELLTENRVSKAIIQCVTHKNQTELEFRQLISDLISGGVYEILFDDSYGLSKRNKKVLDDLLSEICAHYRFPCKFGYCLDNPILDIKEIIDKLKAVGLGECSDSPECTNVFELNLSDIIPSQHTSVFCESLMKKFKAMLVENEMQYLRINWDINFELTIEKIRFLFENCGLDSIDLDLRKAGSRHSIKNVFSAIEQLNREMPGEWLFDVRMAQHSDRFFNAFYTACPPQRRKPFIKRPDSGLRLSKTSDESDDEALELQRVDSAPVSFEHASNSESGASQVRPFKSH